MTRRIKLILAGLGLVVFAVLIYFLVLSPIHGDVAETKKAISAEEGRIAEAKVKLAAAEATRAEGRRNQARLLELAKIVPVSVELPSLILQIQDLADKAGIEWIRITPGEAKDGGTGTYQIVPLALQFSGNYFDVSDFAYRAEQMVAGPGRLLAVKSVVLTVQEVDIVGGAAASPELEVTMDVYAFLLSGTGAAGSTPAAPSQ